MNNLKRNRGAGFTLIEVLIAIFITALIATLAAQSLDSATKSMARGSDLGKRMTEVDRLFLLLEQDLISIRAGERFVFSAEAVSQSLAGAEAFEDRGFSAYREATVDIQQQRQNLIASLDTQNRLLQFVRGDWVNFGVQPRSDLQQVSYAWHQGAIWRFYRPINNEIYGDNTPADAIFDEDFSLARRLVEDVNNIEIRYLEAAPAAANLQSGNPDWKLQWDPNIVLPVAVEVTIDVRDLGELRRIFVLGAQTP